MSHLHTEHYPMRYENIARDVLNSFDFLHGVLRLYQLFPNCTFCSWWYLCGTTTIRESSNRALAAHFFNRLMDTK